MSENEKKDIIYWASLLNQKGFVTARSGNVSCKTSDGNVLLTTHDSYLGHLEDSDIVKVDLEGKVIDGTDEPTSEKDLHLSVYKKFPDTKAVVHSHSPFTTAFFHYFDKLDIFSFEAKFYLGEVAVVAQDTPTVIDVEPVLKALENSSVVVLGNHGVVAIGGSFKEAFSLIELLEEQSKVNLTIKSGNIKENKIEEKQIEKEAAIQKYDMLSKEHIEKLMEIVNLDEEVQSLGGQYDLTCTLAVKNQDSGKVGCFHYERGKITKIDESEDAEFMIIGQEDILRKVFNRQIDPFVAVTQKKVKTKGDFMKMSRWYPVMAKTFKLWEKAPVK